MERHDFDALVVRWTEKGGPAVRATTRRGFGSTIIKRSVPYELKGETEVRYALTGLTARFAIPAAYVRAVPPRVARTVRPEPAAPAPFGGTVLVVEDNMISAWKRKRCSPPWVRTRSTLPPRSVRPSG